MSVKLFGILSKILSVVVWLSSGLFGLYILTFYALALTNGNSDQWNKVLPGLYDSSTPQATQGIGLHFAAGGLILILGSLQFIKSIRKSYPQVHRWVGRLYIFASVFASIGGLIFIIQKGTIGGWLMDVGFAGYGVLMFVCAIQTVRFARAKDFVNHRAWALRLYALAIGSWLYRMEYGFWHAATGLVGHTDTFSGPFDYFMDFFFYLPNLLVAEFFIRKKVFVTKSYLAAIGSFLMLAMIGFIGLATQVFWKHYWSEPILKWLGI
ncbi:DUF2306 domain-containing protein [Lacihabitans lacunae]|uniref:DUF2306 domain-containing protein n=1 Tax=Lacihabitans lacunae TaxID=1028214 RepID=A0ABV7YV05_9BACT